MSDFHRHRSGLWLPTEKPRIEYSPGLVAHNCARMGLPEPVLALAFSEGGGNLLYNAVDGSVSTLTAVGTGNVAEWQGDGFYLEDDGTNGNWFSVPPAAFQGIGSGNYTLAAGGRLDSAAGGARTLFCFDSYDPQWGFTYVTGRLHVYDDGDLFTGVATSVLNKNFDIAYVREGTGSGLLKGYVSGSLDNTGTHAAALPNPTTVRLGWDNYEDEFFCGLVRYVYFWRVALTPAQVARVAAEPYGIVTPARRPAIWLTGETIEFSGTSAGQTATAAAALDVSRSLSSTSSGQSATAAAVLSILRPLTGTAAGQTSTPDDVSAAIARALSGTSAGQASVSEAILAVLRELTGTSALQSITSAAEMHLAGPINFSGTAAAVTQATDAVLSVVRALSGTSSGQSATAAAVLSILRPLTGTAAGQVSTPDDVSAAVARALSGTSAGQVSASEAILAVLRELSGTSALQSGTSVAEMLLAGLINFSGTAAGATQTTAAALSVARALSGVSPGQTAGSDDAILAVARALSGTSDIVLVTSEAAMALVALYPALEQYRGSKAQAKSGIKTDIASNGDVRGQILYSANRNIFYVEHFLSAAEKTTLDTFYNTNKVQDILFTWAKDGQSYNCIFMDAPQYVPIGAGNYNCSVVLAQKDT